VCPELVVKPVDVRIHSPAGHDADLTGEPLIDDLHEPFLVDLTDARQQIRRERAADRVLRMARVTDGVKRPPADVGRAIDLTYRSAGFRVGPAFDGVGDGFVPGIR